MARLPFEHGVPAVVERFVRGSIPVNDTPLLSFVGVPVKGMYLVSFSAEITARDAAVEVKDQEFTVTAAGDPVTVEAGDLFIPFNPAVGAGAGVLNETVFLVPSVSLTDHKIAVKTVNLTAAATDPGLLTLTGLLIKTVATTV